MEWRAVVGFEGVYEVSSEGELRSVRTGVQRKAFPTNKGYLTLKLGGKPGEKQKTRSVHSLVADAFLERPDGAIQVNHIDGDKTNNSASNLEWVTPKQNVEHAIKSGLVDYVERATRRAQLGHNKSQSGSSNFNSRLTEKDILAIRERLSCGETGRAIQREFGVSQSLVSAIKHRRRWAHI